jgi:hypothetical protein
MFNPIIHQSIGSLSPYADQNLPMYNGPSAFSRYGPVPIPEGHEYQTLPNLKTKKAFTKLPLIPYHKGKVNPMTNKQFMTQGSPHNDWPRQERQET